MALPVPQERLRLACGRTIAFRVYGDPGGVPVLCLHGTPGSCNHFSIAHDAAKRQRLALVAPDRWGYGFTEAPPRPTLSAFADDMAMLMDKIRAQRFAVIGVSGGAPYAAAVAARLPARTTALALVSPVGPIADAGHVSLLRLRHRLRFRMLPRRPGAVSAAMRAIRWSTARIPRLAGRFMVWSAARADKPLVRDPKIVQAIIDSVREGLRPGTAGPGIDLALFTRPWMIDLSAVTAPSRVWIGTADATVPMPGVRVLVQRVPGCVLTELPGAGHFWVSLHHADVLAWVVASAIGSSIDDAHGSLA
jgi:pimeloyl-ACP methyl ester carboxylesterase